MVELTGIVTSLEGAEATVTLDDGSERRLTVPEMIEVEVGMSVRIVEFEDGAPVVAWGT